METNLRNTLVGIGYTLFMLLSGWKATAQSSEVRYNNFPQQSSLVTISLKHERYYNAWFESQNMGVIITNRTNDKVFIKLRFTANLTCGQSNSQSIGYISGDGIMLEPGQTIGEDGYSTTRSTMLNVAFGMPASCRPAPGKEKEVSIISSVHYQLISAENISQRERQAEEKRKQEETDRQKKAQLDRENASLRSETQLMIDELPGNEQGSFKSRMTWIASESPASQKSSYLSLQKDVAQRARKVASEQAAKQNEAAKNSSSSGSAGGITVTTSESSPRSGAAGGITVTTSESSGRSQSSNASTTQKSNIVNGIDRSKLPNLGKDPDGNYYKKVANNEYEQISAQEYQALRQEAAKKEAAEKQLANQRAAEQAAAEFRRSQAEAAEKRRLQEENAKQIATNLTNLGMSIYNDISANRAYNEEQDRRIRERDAQANEQGDALLKRYLASAKLGDEIAIGEVDRAYMLKKEEKKRVEFLIDIVNKWDSKVAVKSLMNHYSNVMEKEKRSARYDSKDGITHAIWGVVFGAGSIYLFNVYKKLDAKGEIEDAKFARTWGLLSGLATIPFVIISTVNFAKPSYWKRQRYIDAKSVHDQLVERAKHMKLSFAPFINTRQKNAGLAVRLNF